MSLPEKFKYTKDHEWVELQASEATSSVKVGITDFAQAELGELVFVELPEVGKHVKKGETFCVVESTKAASDVYAPVTGVVSAVNTALTNNPELVNQEPFANGWLVVFEDVLAGDLDCLLSAAEYQSLLGK